MKKRKIDQIASKNYAKLGKRFSLVKKGKIQKLRIAILLAFIVGSVSAIIWGFSNNVYNGSDASVGSVSMNNTCTINPVNITTPVNGVTSFTIASPTDVVINCGSSVLSASYKWDNGEEKSIVTPKSRSVITVYSADKDKTLSISGTYLETKKVRSGFTYRTINSTVPFAKLVYTFAIPKLELKALTVEPAIIDTTNQDQTINVSLTISGGLKGFNFKPDYGEYVMISNGNNSYIFRSKLVRISGDSKLGTYIATTNVPKQSPAGIMKINRVDLEDVDGVRRIYYYDDLKKAGFKGLDIENKSRDITPPNLHNGISISPVSINTTEKDQELKLSMTLTDNNDLGDGSNTQLRITNGVQYVDFKNFTIPTGGSSGNGTYVNYIATATVLKGSAMGKWSVSYLKIFDKAGNEKTYSYNDLVAKGYSYGLVVTNAN